jgi:hypothetical protein
VTAISLVLTTNAGFNHQNAEARSQESKVSPAAGERIGGYTNFENAY